ncbi:MAG: hypothetical protein WEB37_07710 [Bacteroidota bacterium]
MLEKRLFELLNQEVDGTNSAKEHREVQALLSKNADARRTFDALKELSAFLKKAPQFEPPQSLKKRILDSLPRPRPSEQKIFPLFALVQKLTEGTNVRYAYTFAGGAVAGILLFAFLTGSPSDTSSLVGAIGSDHTLTSTQAIRSAEIDLPEIQGTFTAEAAGDKVIASASLNASQELDFIVKFDQDKLQFESFQTPDQSPGALTILSGRLELRGSGAMVYKFIFSRKSADAVALNADIMIDGAKRSDLSLTLEQSSH